MQTGHSNRTRTLAALTALALAGGGAALLTGTASAAPGGELVYGLTENNRLVSFRSQTPGTIISNVPLQNALGVPLADVDILGIDVRPRTGELYGLGDNGQLYVINPATGAVATRGNTITPALQGERFGFDFNPAADRIRIVSDANQNLRVNPDTGGASSVTAPGTNTDGPLRYNDADRNAGLDPQVVAAAYTNSVDLTTTTAQFDIDAATNSLVRQDSNPGILTTIGTGLGAGDVTDAGLDVSPATDTTYALLETPGATAGSTTRTFATIDRTAGTATTVGSVGPAATATTPALTVEDVAVAPGRFLVTATSVTEGDTATVTVRREGDVADAQSVNYAITNGATGSSVEDAVAASGRLDFGVGERSRTFAVTTLDDDFTEGNETLTVALSGATTGAVASNGVLTINDDEAGSATGLTADNRLVDFSVNAPGTATNARPVLNLPNGVTLVGIDTRPRNGELIGVGSNSRIYVINRTTGAATDRGELGVALVGTSFGVDFNPVADRLRIVSDANQNLRVNVDAPGNVAGGAQGTIQDGTLRFNEGDPNVGTDPVVVAAAYTNSFNSGSNNTATPTATMQFDVEAATRTLVRQDSNPGTLNTIGALGLADGTTLVPTAVGLDIAAAGNAAFASFSTSTTAARQLFRVNLATGRATSLGNLATPMALAEGGTTTIEDFTLNATDRATFTPPTASPTASASATATASASATPTATQSASPTPTGTATPPPLPVCTSPLTVTTDRAFIIPTIPVTVTVSGAAPFALVDLQAYSRPSDQYRSVRTQAADAQGRVSFDVTPGTNTRLFAQCVNQAGGQGQGASVSNQRVINVRTALSLTVVRNGTRNYTFQGRILPRRAGQLVTLYRVERDGRRVITSQLKTDASGTYRFTRQFTGSGTFGFLARTGQTLTNAAGESTSAQGQRSEAYLQSGRGTARPTAIF